MIAKLMITVRQVSNRSGHMKPGIRRIWTLSLTHSMDNRKTGSLSTIHAHSTQTFTPLLPRHAERWRKRILLLFTSLSTGFHFTLL